MSETEQLIVIENMTEVQRTFLEAIAVMPKSGIALRGDPIVRAKQLQDGISEPQVNYIVFLPPTICPKTWGQEAKILYRQLSSAIDMALVYADPWYDNGARTPITEPNFASYISYYTDNPDKLPAITWFTEVQGGQFQQVVDMGRTWLDYEVTHHTGDVSSFGAIPSEKIGPVVVLDNEDIKSAQKNLLTNLELSTVPIQGIKQSVRERLVRLITKKGSRLSEESVLRGKRQKFRSELGKISTLKLCESVRDTLKLT